MQVFNCENNMCRSLSISSIWLVELLITVCALVVCVSTLEFPNFQHVAYKDVLKTRAHEIQSEINELHNNEYISLFCRHRPVYIDHSTKVVILVWASDRETHAMRNCMYQDIKRIGKNIIRMLQFSSISSVLNRSFNLCNKGPVVTWADEISSGTMLLSFYVNDTESDGLIVDGRVTASFSKSDVLDVVSAITVRILNAAKRRVWTFVCNSIQLAWNDTGKLQQRFFSLVGNSTEVMVRSFRAGNASVTLDFDVLMLNASRPGLLNHSDVELLSLSDLQVSCIKLDQYGLNNESTEIIYTNVTEEITMRTKLSIINNKLQLHLKVSVPVLSDHSFGEYVCLTYCKLQTNNNNKIISCIQKKSFSIVLDSWRTDNLLYRQENKYCKESMKSITESYVTNITHVSNVWKVTTDNFITEYEKCSKVTHYCLTQYTNAKSELVSWQIMFYVLLIVICAPVIINKLLLLLRFLRQRSYLKTLTSLQSVLQSTENSQKRNTKYDVFLSYSSKDRPWVQSTLLKFIESKGFKVCFDERDFLIGCNLVETIAKAVCDSRKVVAVLSPDYLSSRWCIQYEFLLTYTRILNKESPFNSLLPIKYRDCQIPEHMNCLKYLDYTKVTAACDRSVIVKILSRLWFYKQPDIEPTSEAQFFDDLLSWLGKPQAVEQLQ